MKLFRPLQIFALSEHALDGTPYEPAGHHRVLMIMEPELGDIRRVDMLVPHNATAKETIALFEKATKNMRPSPEGADFAP